MYDNNDDDDKLITIKYKDKKDLLMFVQKKI